MTSRDSLEQQIKDCYSTWGTRYFQDYYESQSAYPPVHVEIVRSILNSTNPSTTLDVGCGPASTIRLLADLQTQFYGFDLTPEMVDEAKSVCTSLALDASRIWQASALDLSSYKAPDGIDTYDAAVCLGVLPHVTEKDDLLVLNNIYHSLNSGGQIVLEARNALFSLFTLNRYTHNFFLQSLISKDHINSLCSDKESYLGFTNQFQQFFAMDLPPIRTGYASEPGYDQVLSRTHNPFVLSKQAESVGYTNVKTLFYHYHALPPLFEGLDPSLYRKLSLSLEDPEDWKGHFMASAFILTATKP